MKKGGLATTVVSRRLQCISDITEELQSFEVRRVDSDNNTSDVLTRDDGNFAVMLTSLEGESGIDIEGDLSEPTAAAALVGDLVYDDLILNLGVIVEAQYDDEVCYKVRRALQANRLAPESIPIVLQQVLPEISINEYDVLVRDYYAPCKGEVVSVPVIPDSLKAEVVHGIHSLLCHCGCRRTLEVLSGLCWFVDMLTEAAAMLSNCDVCSRQSRPMIVKHDIGLFSPERLREAVPFSVVSADVVYLSEPYLSQQCAVSKFACLIGLTSEGATTIAQAFERSWAIIGKRPVYLLTDNAAAFLSCELPGVTRLYTPVRSSQSNGMVESLHRTVRRWVRAVLADDPSIGVEAAIHRVMTHNL